MNICLRPQISDIFLLEINIRTTLRRSKCYCYVILLTSCEMIQLFNCNTGKISIAVIVKWVFFFIISYFISIISQYFGFWRDYLNKLFFSLLFRWAAYVINYIEHVMYVVHNSTNYIYFLKCDRWYVIISFALLVHDIFIDILINYYIIILHSYISRFISI